MANADKAPSRFGPLSAWYSPKRLRFWLIALVLIYTLVGFFLLPWVAKQQTVKLLSKQLERPVSLEKVTFNPFLLKLDAQNFQIDDIDGTKLLAFDRLFVDFQLASVVKWAANFRELSLDKPYINIIREADGKVNLINILASFNSNKTPTDPPAEEEEAAGLLRAVIDEFAINEGTIDVTDRTLKTPFSTHIQPINIALSNVSTLADDGGQQEVLIASESGTRITWRGESQINPLHSKGTITGEGGYIPLLYRYFQDQLSISLSEGQANFVLDYEVDTLPNSGFSFKVVNLDFSLDGVTGTSASADGKESKFLRLPHMELNDAQLSWPERVATIESFIINEAALELWRTADGTFSFQQWLGASAADTTSEATEAPAPEVTAADTVDVSAEAPAAGNPAATQDSDTQSASSSKPPAGGDQAADTTADAGATAPQDNSTATEGALTEDSEQGVSPLDEWSINIKEIRLADFTAGFIDHSVRDPQRLEASDVDLSIGPITNEENARFPLQLGVSMASGGQINLKGDVAVLPDVLFDTTLQVQDLNVAMVQPWLGDVTHAVMEDGALNIAATIKQESGAPLTVDGNIKFLDLEISDGGRSESLIGWQQLDVENLQYSRDAKPPGKSSLNISEILLAKPYLRLRIAEDGTTNFQDLAIEKKPEGAAPSSTDNAQSKDDKKQANATPAGQTPAAQDSPPMEVMLGNAVFDNGTIDFEDLSLPLPFSTKMQNLDGELSTLSTTSREPSRIKLEGKIDRYGYASIEGKMLPADPAKDTDIHMLLRNVAFPGLSPYTVKFAGREIDEGRLELDLKYRIKQGQLEASNSMVIDKLKLGAKVDNPDAMNLPLGVATSLLTGPDGRIKIDLPVTGDVNDPKFKISGVIMRAFGTLLAKVVSSPFRALGKLAGVDSEDFDKIEFQAGRSDLTPPEMEKLVLLSNALAQRPQLGLLVPGVYSEEADTTALKSTNVDAKIDALLASDKKRKRGDNDTMLAKKRRKAIEKLYKKQASGQSLRTVKAQYKVPVDPAKPQGKKRFDELAYTEGLRDQLIAAEVVAKSDLQALAKARSATIIDALINPENPKQKLDKKRVNVAPAEQVKPNKRDFITLTLKLKT